MIAPFSFEGRISRARYALGALAAFFSQHVLALVLCGPAMAYRPPAWWFWVSPFWAIARREHRLAPWGQMLVVAVALVAAWIMVALAFRRGRTARGDWLAPLAVAPVFQVIPLVWFIIAPKRPETPEPRDVNVEPDRRDAIIGLLTGAGLSLALVALSTLVFRSYGWGLFFASPFVIGMTTSYLVNRRGEESLSRSFSIVCLALCLGALILIAFALEGVICLMIASPLIFGMAFIGCGVGSAIAAARRGPGATLTSIAVLPLLFLGEIAAPPKTSFESVESVEVAASPNEVWDAIVNMGPIPDAPAAPFRWGLAYPMRGEIRGEGIGAIRQGVFSTGVAYERVTEWQPGRKLSFVVLSDPPTLQEISPYRTVNAPHLQGYFRTLDARFTIDALPSGKTRLTLATKHELDLAPAAYWSPIAQWAVEANKERVLAHFRRQAERASQGFS